MKSTGTEDADRFDDSCPECEDGRLWWRENTDAHDPPWNAECEECGIIQIEP